MAAATKALARTPRWAVVDVESVWILRALAQAHPPKKTVADDLYDGELFETSGHFDADFLTKLLGQRGRYLARLTPAAGPTPA